MPLNWDDDEEELTELEYPRRPGRVLDREEMTPAPEDRTRPTPPPLRRTTSFAQAQQSAPPPASTHQVTHYTTGLLPAPPRDRFVAFFLDSLIGFYLYWFLGFLLNAFFEVPNLNVLHQSAGRYAVHLFLTFGVFFFYYLLMESVFGATLGKFFCRLYVIEENGNRPSLGNVFIRNILRIVDYPFAFIVAVITMESSPLNQRLGDRAAKTIVIKKSRRLLPAVDLQHTPLASTLSRMFAEGIDLILSLTLIYSIILLLSSARPLLSYVLLISTPAIFIGYYTIIELLTETTPGKALFKRRVVLDNGQPLDGTAAFLRNLFRPLDYLIGYPLLVLTKKKQRLGDMAADTLVVVKSPDRKGIIGAGAAVLLVLLLAYVGFTNPNSIIRKDYGMGPVEGLKILLQPLRAVLPGSTSGKIIPKMPRTASTTVNKPSQKLPQSTSDKLKLVEFYFATGPEPAQIRHDRKFRQGDTVYIFFKIQGFEIDSNNQASLSEDLQVEDPNQKLIISSPQIVQLTKPIDDKTKSILFANNVSLPKDSPNGNYRVLFTVYDHAAETQFSFEKNFDLQ
jgi:uncharacterized RDD family membrane protein YckC